MKKYLLVIACALMGAAAASAQTYKTEKDISKSTKQYVAELLGVPEQYEPLCIVGFGHKNMDRKPYEDDKIEWTKVHNNKF